MTTEWSSADPAFLAAYGDVIRRLREERGIERKDLAEEAQISYSYLSAIESGQKFPSGTVQTSLAEVLETDPSDILAEANGTRAAELGASLSDRVAAARFVGFSAPEMRSVARMVAPNLTPPSDEVEPSVSGASAELGALLAKMSGEDRAMLLSMARRLADDRSRAVGRTTERPASPSFSARFSTQPGQRLRTEAYLEFWTMYVNELEHRGLDWAQGRWPEPRSYFTTPSPIRGASFSTSFARNRLLRHELYINRGSRDANLQLLTELEQHRHEIERIYGARLDFEDPGRERQAVRIAEYRPGHISKADEYPDYVAWFIDRGERMRRALAGVRSDSF